MAGDVSYNKTSDGVLSRAVFYPSHCDWWR